MNLEDSDSDDSLLKVQTRRQRGKAVEKVTKASINKTLREHESAHKAHEEVRAWQKENVKVSDQGLGEIVQSIISTTQKNRKQTSRREQEETDAKLGYDGAFPRKDFEAMKEIIESESTIRQGTLPTICFAINNEFFFRSKEEACFALKTGLDSLKPCELGSRIPALIEKDLLKHFLRSSRFQKLFDIGDQDIIGMVKGWLFKVACSAGCDDLSDLGYAALQAIQTIGDCPLSVGSFQGLLSCWLGAPTESSASGGNQNISGLRNVILLAAEHCQFDTAAPHELGELLTQLLQVGLDSATTIGFSAPLNSVLCLVVCSIAQKQTDTFDSWCKAWSKDFVGKIKERGAPDHWLSLSAAVRLVDFSWSAAMMSFRTIFSTAVLLECTEAVGTEEISLDKWLQTDRSEYLAAAASSLHWKALCAAYFSLYQTLKCFDDIVEHQTRLRATIEAVLLVYCCGNVVFDNKQATKEDLKLQENFLDDFDRTTEKLQGGKTGKITSPHIMCADYLLSIIHSHNTSLKGCLEERQRIFGVGKQSDISSFFKPKAPELSS